MNTLGLTKPILWLLFLVALLIGISVVSGVYRPPTQGRIANNDEIPLDVNGVRIPPPMPQRRPEDIITTDKAQAFQVLVSYTGVFEPSSVSLRAGDTVRFTNNSTKKLWVAASGDALYPSVQNGCGSSALDSCKALPPGEYWQFTFTKAGTWAFHNNLDKDKTGVVVVRVSK